MILDMRLLLPRHTRSLPSLARRVRTAARMASTNTPRPTLITVIGATGTGKSNLAVDLALALSGEIINADAMQMYQGLPIITNKITTPEMRNVPHHLLGFLPVTDAWRVGRFVREAERIIDEIRSRGRLPILVGGTHYYVQSLLFPHSIPNDETELLEETYPFPPLSGEKLEEKYPILASPTPTLYAHLRTIDPLIASRWHPNDRRKILRSLQIYYASNRTRTASQIYASQRPTTQTRYRNLVFWVHAETETLRARLDKRVDGMVAGGMWAEVEEMKAMWDSGKQAGGVDLGSGIWQSIGFKEFLPYLEMRDTGGCGEKGLEEERRRGLEEERRRGLEEERRRGLEEERRRGLEGMKTATRQYAKSQVKWIRIKFLNALNAGQSIENPNGDIFLLDSTDVNAFAVNVSRRAVELAKDFLESRPLPPPTSLSPLAALSLPPKRAYDFAHRPDLWVQRVCTLCNVTCVNDAEFTIHERSQRHKKTVQREKRRPEVEAFINARREKERQREMGVLVGLLERVVERGREGENGGGGGENGDVDTGK